MPTRGEVWWVNFDPSVGAEIVKKRPAVVISADTVGALPLRIVVPLTGSTRSAGESWMVEIKATRRNGLTKDSVADAFQVKSVSIDRFDTRAGTLTAQQMDDIAAAIALCIDYNP
jgi:mRNA interferase MazF